MNIDFSTLDYNWFVVPLEQRSRSPEMEYEESEKKFYERNTTLKKIYHEKC